MSEKPEQCDCCYFPTADLEEFRCESLLKQGATKWLCGICSNTEAGRMLDYPTQFEGQAATIRTVCHVGNMILAELKKRS